jgi:hypothetical protein
MAGQNNGAEFLARFGFDALDLVALKHNHLASQKFYQRS